MRRVGSWIVTLAIGLAGSLASSPASASRLLERPGRYVDVAGELVAEPAAARAADATLKSTTKAAPSLTASSSDSGFDLFDAVCARPPLCLGGAELGGKAHWPQSLAVVEALEVASYQRARTENRRNAGFWLFAEADLVPQLLANPPPERGLRLFAAAARTNEFARARWYDARNASWLSEDPLLDVDSPNLYAFVGWQPTMATDPLGLESFGEFTERFAVDAYAGDSWLAMAGAFGLQALHATFQVASVGAVGKIDRAQEQLDRGQINRSQYWTQAGAAVGQTAVTYSMLGVRLRAHWPVVVRSLFWEVALRQLAVRGWWVLYPVLRVGPQAFFFQMRSAMWRVLKKGCPPRPSTSWPARSAQQLALPPRHGQRFHGPVSAT